jgi:hypothetical protein
MSRTAARPRPGRSGQDLTQHLSPRAICEAVASRLSRRWHLDVAAEHAAAGQAVVSAEEPEGYPEVADERSVWPMTIGFGASRTCSALECEWDRLLPAILTLRRWAETEGLSIDDDPRRVFGAMQPIPVRIHIPDLTTATRLAGGTLPELVASARARVAELARRLDEHRPLDHLPDLLRRTAGWSDLDTEILLHVSDWFTTNHERARGRTPRQVPIPGVQAKWLNRHHDLVCKLAGIESLGLADPHPARIHFTYLDPTYRGDPTNRVHDSASVGDAVTLPYRPRVVIISENKDTAICFPLLAGAVSVEGVGKGGGTAARFDWIRHAEILVYWGDLDADGLEILDGFRAAGLDAKSILMDSNTWRRFEHLGTNHYPDGRLVLAKPKPAPTPHLDEAEQALYLALCDPDRTEYRRLEQERIPLKDALAAVKALQPG